MRKPAKILTVREDERTDAAAQLMATAIAFDKAGRPVPSGILRRLWGLRFEWKRRRDVPESVRAACELLDRHSPTTKRTKP